ncbi:polyphosphate kinase 1 [Oceanirhabdus sp. W0125-5]|uniref:polyphosphate kinase 1 n=1 Tax=Oceanirhabdus sp. W0125-5 TaxID=2999116 RepID=UPI0022F2FD75|nr:polyphosphate kinase 1 [Oceanirhabdus sp. W0125-5]WBW97519.1 polyphosphate kinase 1 [Oceanirhabdus sp. W0125-5]
MFSDREISLLKFNNRVLNEAMNKRNPLLERVNFLGIVSKNIDEFYKTRMCRIIEDKFNEHVVCEINNYINELIIKKRKIYKVLMSNLKKNNILILNDNSDIEKNIFNSLIEEDINDNLMVIDYNENLIDLKCGNIYICLIIKDKSDKIVFYDTKNKNRLIRVCSTESDSKFILKEEFLMEYLIQKYKGSIIGKCIFRITRDSSLVFREYKKENYLSFVENNIKKRLEGTILRLEIYKSDNSIVIEYLKNKMLLDESTIFRKDIPIDLSFFMDLKREIENKSLKFNEFNSLMPIEIVDNDNIFKVLREKDIFLHHPFDSFEALLKLLDYAVKDNSVLSIKQTLYRVSQSSYIVKKLIEASKKGIKVTVLLELRARFDEDNNILWAKKLEESGCNVIYGVKGLKTHAKVLMITRKNEEFIERFVHLSTGNYNEITANLYTDIGIISNDKKLTSDISKFFNMITGISEYVDMERIFISPINMRDEFENLINKEIRNVEKGHKGKIIAKFNSLEDKKIIKLLYKAAKKGVKIKLIVRGVCCLKITDDIKNNIEVRSIIGRFLEHSRIYYFYNKGNEKIFISSADWMERNLDRRIELLVPILDKHIRNKIKEILKLYLKDNTNAWRLNNDSEYKHIKVNGNEKINCQEYHLQKNDQKYYRADEIEEFMPLMRNDDKK